jgi:Nucleotidyl transferase AbiEii toxin, Type IV TA system
MRALTFWKMVTMDHADFLERLLALLQEAGITFCVIGGQAVNAYVEPVVSLDLDLVVAVNQLAEAEALLAEVFTVRRFPHSLNVSASGSDLRAQIQTDPRYGDFVERAGLREVLGLQLPVASVEDILRGKVWAAQDSTRRASKRQKDLADIARLLEAYPALRAQVPPALLDRLV